MVHILCYGDSLTAGFCSGGRQFEPYSRTLESTLVEAGSDNPRVIECGLSGLTAEEMVADLDSGMIVDVCRMRRQGLRWLMAEHGVPDLVIIMAGTNDFAYQRDMSVILQDIITLHEACHEFGAKTIAMAPPSTDRSARKALSLRLKAWAKRTPDVIAFVDPEVNIVPRHRCECWEPDNVHLSPYGYQCLGRELAMIVLAKYDENAEEQGGALDLIKEFSGRLGRKKANVEHAMYALSGRMQRKDGKGMSAKLRNHATGLLRKVRRDD